MLATAGKWGCKYCNRLFGNALNPHSQSSVLIPHGKFPLTVIPYLKF